METVQTKKSRLLPIFIVFFVDNFGFSLVFTLFAPLLLNLSFGLVEPSYTVATRNMLIGVLFSVFPLAQFFGAPFIGDFADHYGRKKAFVFSLFGAVVGYVLSALGVIFHSFTILVISRFISGFCAGNLGICLASIADLSHSERSRGRNYGFLATIAGVSWICSMIVGSYLADPRFGRDFNPAVPFLISAFLCLLALVCVIFYYHETRVLKDRPLEVDFSVGMKNILTAFKITEVRFLYFIYFLWIVGWGAVIQWFTPYAIEKFHIVTEDMAWGLILFGISWSIGGAVLNYILLKKIKSHLAVIFSLIFSTILVGVSSFFNSYEYFAISIVLSAGFGGVAMANILNLISMTAPYHMQGKVMGLSQSVIALSWILGPLIGGAFAREGIRDIYLFATAFIFLTLMLVVIKYQMKKENKIA